MAAAPGWAMYDEAEIRILGKQARQEGLDHERTCPVCGQQSVRTYRYFSSRLTGPTLISYVWCSRCRRYAGSTGPRPPTLALEDPLTVADRKRLEGDIFGLLLHLDQLWEEGKLPQVTRAPGKR